MYVNSNQREISTLKRLGLEKFDINDSDYIPTGFKKKKEEEVEFAYDKRKKRMIGQLDSMMKQISDEMDPDSDSDSKDSTKKFTFSDTGIDWFENWKPDVSNIPEYSDPEWAIIVQNAPERFLPLLGVRRSPDWSFNSAISDEIHAGITKDLLNIEHAQEIFQSGLKEEKVAFIKDAIANWNEDPGFVTDYYQKALSAEKKIDFDNSGGDPILKALNDDKKINLDRNMDHIWEPDHPDSDPLALIVRGAIEDRRKLFGECLDYLRNPFVEEDVAKTGEDIIAEWGITDYSLSEQNIGKFATIERDIWLQEGFPPSIAKYLTQLWPQQPEKQNVVNFLIRKDAIDLANKLREKLKKEFILLPQDNFELVDGVRGVGKSALLLTIVHWARMTGWLVLYVNAASDIINNPTIRMRNPYIGTWDQPALAGAVCSSMLDAHRPDLEKIPLRTEFSIGEKDLWRLEPDEGPPSPGEFVSSPEKSLADLLQYGETFWWSSSEVMRHFRAELNSVTEMPVLIVVDEFNALHNKSARVLDPDESYSKNLRLKPMAADKFTLANCFSEHLHHGLIRGTYVGALTSTRTPLDKKVFPRKIQPTVHLNPFTPDEVSLYIDFLDKHNLGYHSRNPPPFVRKHIWGVTQGRPLEIWRYLTSTYCLPALPPSLTLPPEVIGPSPPFKLSAHKLAQQQQ